MKGSFDITCVKHEDGVTAVGAQSISVPWHMSKPYWTGRVLMVQAVNATAGILAGDQLDFRVQVDSGARLLLTSPSASRIYTMPTGEATLRQDVRIASGGWLEWMPELFIPHRDCRYRQHTTIELERDATLYLAETLAPGRVAHGEAFAFEWLKWSTHIRYDGQLMLAENYRWSPHDQSLRDLRMNGAHRYFASAILVHPAAHPLRDWQEALATWNNSDLMIGATQLAPQAYLFRLLAANSETLKETLSRLRILLSEQIDLLRESARKL